MAFCEWGADVCSPDLFHVEGGRAALAFDSPIAARPLVARFEEIWATGEPGLTGTVLGL